MRAISAQKKNELPFADRGFNAATLFSFTVKLNTAVERSANPFPDAEIRSVLTPVGANVFPDGKKDTSSRDVTKSLTPGSLNCNPAIGATSAAAIELSNEDML
jgi:hypothetical protein